MKFRTIIFQCDKNKQKTYAPKSPYRQDTILLCRKDVARNLISSIGTSLTPR